MADNQNSTSNWLDARDEIARARYLTNAIFMACEGLERDDCNSIQAICDALGERLLAAASALEKAEPPEEALKAA